MALDAIKSSMKTAIETVTGIGTVHDYLRNWKGDQKLFHDQFKVADTGKIHAWQMTRLSTTEKPHNQDNNSIRRHNLLVFGVHALEDSTATEKTFQDLVEAVCVKLRAESKQPTPLSGTAWRMGLPQVDRVDHRKFNNILVHACDITVWVDEWINY